MLPGVALREGPVVGDSHHASLQESHDSLSLAVPRWHGETDVPAEARVGHVSATPRSGTALVPPLMVLDVPGVCFTADVFKHDTPIVATGGVAADTIVAVQS